MKTHRPGRLAVLAWVAAGALSSLLPPAFAQGPLAPAGPPAPTMKSLDQIEPRTPISSAPFTITGSGSYYLTTNVTVATGDAITISGSGVNLDLNGFTISSTAPSPNGTAINLVAGSGDITLLNGHIVSGVTNNGSGVYSGPGFANGIFGSIPSANVRVTGISVSGCLSSGIYLAQVTNSVVESCTLYDNAGYGVLAGNVFHTTSFSGSEAIYAAGVASDCNGTSTGSGSGVSAATANNCVGFSQTGYGVTAGNTFNCVGSTIGGTGLYADSCADNCNGACGGSGTGLYANVANNCLGFSLFGTGLTAGRLASGCDGESSGGSVGMNVAGTAENCSGTCSGGTAISCAIAIGCTTFGGSIVAPSGKFLGTP